MPVYELIILCRIGETQGIANLIKNLVNCVYQEGGVIRQVYNLGDRISDRSFKTKDDNKVSMVRYLCVEFDANPDSKIVAEKVARNNSESLKVFCHKIKEKEYYKQIVDKETWKQYIVDLDQSYYKNEMVDILAKEKKNLGEKFEENFQKVKNNLI
jgi:hypothetical protein